MIYSKVQLSSSSASAIVFRCTKRVTQSDHPNPLRLGFAGLIWHQKSYTNPLLLNYDPLAFPWLLILLVRLSKWLQWISAEDYIFPLLEYDFFFYGQLSRKSLTRFWSLQHIGVFPSIHPEAFGISAAEIMCSGLLLCSTGVGGASEMFTHGQTGLMFKADNAQSLFQSICSVIGNVNLLPRISTNAHDQISRRFSVSSSVALIEDYFLAS